MALWLVRAGKHGENEATALEKGLSSIGWEELPDLSGLGTKAELESAMISAYPDTAINAVHNWVGQVWAFGTRIKLGDLIALPRKSSATLAIGRVTGPYKYRTDLGDIRHTMPTEWLRTDIARQALDDDLRFSLGAFMTVCQIQRNNAEARIKALATAPSVVGPPPSGDDDPGPFDIETYVQDELAAFLARRFRGHHMALLVDEILRAQGYTTLLSPPGADGGADILAGTGPMGFGETRLCVQVKTSDTQVDVTVLRDLQGTMKNFGAKQGLLVSTGGFKSTVLAEARRNFFEVRLWDAETLVSNVLAHYEAFSDEMKAALPLKRIWTLALPSSE
jgi:restriction system protein